MTNFYSICLTLLSFCLFASCGNTPFSKASGSQVQSNEIKAKKVIYRCKNLKKMTQLINRRKNCTLLYLEEE
jgi:hypothetical protein